MKISEAMAAVTLLALANGAGDVITAIVAGRTLEKAILWNLKEINNMSNETKGSGFFVNSQNLEIAENS